ncbi:D-alanine--D-alanine ligase [Gammaproteobacteria bacterium 45_16_T64]|nr:D-alanine--D-alanine ligase [Gammaproteobacteria bacterium 45_16_T64]
MNMQVERFGKVGVLFGGNSAERAISLRSGHAVLEALVAAGVDAIGIDVNFDDTLFTQLSGIDRAFVVLHGRGGEDGVIQSVLEVMGIPYTGSGVLASALGMDKSRTKRLWLGGGIPTPDFVEVNDESDLPGVFERLNGNIMVKPAREGSSIGMSHVTTEDDLLRAFSKAKEHDEAVLLERWIEGPEFTCAILDGTALPVIELITENDFYDFEAKYQSDDTQYLCPCALSAEKERELKALSVLAFSEIGCEGWGRVDTMMDEDGKFWLLEVNTVPGMTDHSLVPMAAKVSGLDMKALVVSILDATITSGQA